ncbi:hypothetical protein EW146_g2791 [Bondarzewia mesenterica]|uniref:Hydrophobin n=1 Tax=Bondarzewia mesenterica TaxID=1095465 RepID=A0A4S4M1X4_9AGAM|nr:hypothetical protein EW146_g2791 [Bondarzewia mesenterica]
MPSFAKIFSFATLAFGALVSAAPLTPAANVPRCGCESVAVVLTGLTTSLQPLCGELGYIVAGNATHEAVQPIIADVTVVISDAVNALNNLVDKPVADILLTVDGTAQITLTEVAQLLAGVICLVFGALGHVVGCVKGDISAIVTVIVPVGQLVAGLVAIVIKLVGAVLGDVLVALIPLIVDVKLTILHLNLTALISVLCLQV